MPTHKLEPQDPLKAQGLSCRQVSSYCTITADLSNLSSEHTDHMRASTRLEGTMLRLACLRMHAGAETDPSDTINEIIFSTRKVRGVHQPLALCACSLAWR